MFIEKPLSHNIDEVHELIKEVEKRNLVAFMAYNLRFHPMMDKIKIWLERKIIGKLLNVNISLTSRMTDWHPWEDYRKSYVSRKDLGGGVVLSQSHELDYLYYLFGMPEWVFAEGGNSGILDIDVEDTVTSILKFKDVCASLHINYVSKIQKRTLEITGEKGTILWDQEDKSLSLTTVKNGTEIFQDSKIFNKNTTFLTELERFLLSIKTNKISPIGLRQGTDVLKIALATLRSMEEGRKVYL